MSCPAVLAINTLHITTNENKVLSVDLTNWLHIKEKVIGVSSVTITPAGGPTISEIGYDTIGKAISFRANATTLGVLKKEFEVSVVFTTQKFTVQNQVEAKGKLIVC